MREVTWQVVRLLALRASTFSSRSTAAVANSSFEQRASQTRNFGCVSALECVMRTWVGQQITAGAAFGCCLSTLYQEHFELERAATEVCSAYRLTLPSDTRFSPLLVPSPSSFSPP